MLLVLFLPWLPNWLRPVGVHPPSDNPHPGLSLREVVTFLALERHQTPDQYWSLWLPVLEGPAARSGHVPVHLNAKASLTTEMGVHSLGHLVAAALLSMEFTVEWGACWCSRKVTLRKHCHVTSAHPSWSRRSEELSLFFRGMWWHVWVPTLPTYLKIPKHGCLPLSSSKTQVIFIFNGMMVPLSTHWDLFILSNWIISFMVIC